MTMVQIGDCFIFREDDQPRQARVRPPFVPKVELIKRLLVDHHFDQHGRRARSVVLEARATLEAHLREAWNGKAVVVSGESAIRTGCGCDYCQAWGPIAEIELPIEQRDPRTRTVAVVRVPAEDLYRTTSKLQEAYDIVKKRRRVTPGESGA